VDTYDKMMNERHLCACGCVPEYLEGFEDARRDVELCGAKLERLQSLEKQELAATEEKKERLRQEEAERKNKRLMEEAVAIAVQKVRDELEESKRAENEAVLRTAAEQSVYDFNVDFFDQ